MLLGFFTITQGFAVNGINNVNTVSMERRFRLPSYRAGMISSSYDLSAGVAALFVGFFGGNAHKPRLLGCAALTMALGSFVMALPQFLTGAYQPGCEKSDSCFANGTHESSMSVGCDANDTEAAQLPSYLYVLIAGQMLHGIGGTCLFTLGVAFMDENVSSQRSPMFMGCFYALASTGPTIGYILGGYLLRFYVDIHLTPPDGISITDPRWVGAWWIGFIGSCFSFLIVSLLMFALPRELSGASEIKVSKVSQAHAGIKMDMIQVSPKQLPAALSLLLKNPVFVLLSLAGASDGIATTGVATFIPKLLQNQFQLSPSSAAIYLGAINLCTVTTAEILSGIVCGRMKLKVKGMLRMAIASSLIYIAVTPSLLVRCDSSFSKTSGELQANCNNHCGCTTFLSKPVCDSNGIEYFSPCFAGCSGRASSKEAIGAIFMNCTCTASNSNEVTNGRCGTNCRRLALFLPFFGLLVFTTFFTMVPVNGATMRCLPDSQRTFGLGVQWVFVRFLGTIPGPLLFGRIFDSTCLIWQDLDGGKTGSCWSYDSSLMGVNLFILCACVKAVTLTCYCLAYFLYVPPTKTQTNEIVSEQSSGEAHL